MFLKKVLNQTNLVGTVLIALIVCSGFVYAFAFDGFNVETATGGEVEAWLTQAAGGGYNETCDNCGYSSSCPGATCNCNGGSGRNPCHNSCQGRGSCLPACTKGGKGQGKMCPGLTTCKGCN